VNGCRRSGTRDQGRAMRAEGLGPAKIASQLGVARSVYRMLEAPGLEVA
jgi:hypothetical protein